MKTYPFFFILLVTAVACDSLEAPSDNKCETVFRHSISENYAITVANNFLKSEHTLKTRSDVDEQRTFSIGSKSDDPIMYVINYSDSGFVIVSGDKRLYPILAYSDNGSFPQEKNTYPDGLQLWIDDVTYEITQIIENNEDQDALTKSVWDRFEKEHLDTRTVPADTEYWNNLYDNIAGPLLTTTWYQESPYNNSLPYISGTTQHAYVGCVPIAIAQILRYFQYPTSYNWSSMPDSFANFALYDLIDDVWGFFGSALSYSTNGTHISSNYNLADYLKNNFGYSSATWSNYDKSYDRNIVKNELLNNNRPVILGGFAGNNSSSLGHVWICDGVHEWQEDYYDGVNHNVFGLLYFHNVWGLQPAAYNGWYAFDIFRPKYSDGTGIHTSNYDYSHTMKILYNIVP